MQQVVFVAVICAIAVGQPPAPAPADQPLTRLLLVAACALLVAATGRFLSALGRAESLPRGLPRHRWRLRLEWWFLLSWLGIVAFVLGVLGWASLVRVTWGLQGTILLDELVILAPLLLPLSAAWPRLDDGVHRGRAPDGMQPCPGRLAPPRLPLPGLWALGLLPVLAVCLGADVGRWWSHVPPGQTLSPLWFISPLTILLAVYPWLLRRLWHCRPMPDGPLRNEVLHLADQHGIRLRNVLVWPTGPEIRNAAVAGIAPQARYLFLSAGLLRENSHSHLRSVVAHELGHVAEGHLRWRLAAVLLPIWVYSLSVPFAEGIPWAEHVALGCTLAYLLWGLGWYSRQLEHQADLWACRSLVAQADSPSAGDDYCRTLQLLMEQPPSQGPSWLHPGLAQRCRFVHRALADPRFAHRFERRLCAVSWLLATATLLGLSCLAMG